MIPVEAVEAAAKAMNSDFTNQWEKLPEWIKADIRRETATALEAAAPYMLAEAWDEGYAAESDYAPPINPYRSQP